MPAALKTSGADKQKTAVSRGLINARRACSHPVTGYDGGRRGRYETGIPKSHKRFPASNPSIALCYLIIPDNGCSFGLSVTFSADYTCFGRGVNKLF
jgi:hypothetical protein